MTIYKKQHPLLKVGADQEFHICFVQIFLEYLILVSNLDIWIIDFDKITLDWHGLSVLAKVLLTIKQRIDCYKFTPILTFHELTLDDTNLSLQALYRKDIILYVALECLLSEAGFNCVKVFLVPIELQKFDREIILLILDCFLFE